MSSAVDLKVDWCSQEAARYAVERWHYSRSMPGGKLARLGVWENCGHGNGFVGAVVFGSGATPNIGKPYGLRQVNVCELVRVALSRGHVTPVSRLLAVSLKMLKRAMPALRLVVSYADASQGHHGGIYQANGWVYVGRSEYHAYRVCGKTVHPKTIHSKWGHLGPAQSVTWLRKHVDPRAERINNGVKHKYLMPLDGEMSARVTPLAQPYPKRAGSIGVDAPVDQTGEGGSTPTSALQ